LETQKDVFPAGREKKFKLRYWSGGVMGEWMNGLMDEWIIGVVKKKDRIGACKRVQEANRVLTAAKNQRSGSIAADSKDADGVPAVVAWCLWRCA
jgi:hypothetical protein